MSRKSPPRVFLSAVTPELGSFREQVARVLRRKEIEVRDQEHFRQGPATLLEQLRDYIWACEVVIHLCGHRAGAIPSDAHLAALGSIPTLDEFMTWTGSPIVSYTQMEYILAKHFGKKRFVYFAEPSFTPDTPNTEDTVRQKCQEDYRRWIDHIGEHRGPLTSREKLIEDVLVLEDWEVRSWGSFAWGEASTTRRILLGGTIATFFMAPHIPRIIESRNGENRKRDRARELFQDLFGAPSRIRQCHSGGHPDNVVAEDTLRSVFGMLDGQRDVDHDGNELKINPEGDQIAFGGPNSTKLTELAWEFEGAGPRHLKRTNAIVPLRYVGASDERDPDLVSFLFKYRQPNRPTDHYSVPWHFTDAKRPSDPLIPSEGKYLETIEVNGKATSVYEPRKSFLVVTVRRRML